MVRFNLFNSELERSGLVGFGGLVRGGFSILLIVRY